MLACDGIWDVMSNQVGPLVLGEGLGKVLSSELVSRVVCHI